MPSLLTSIPRDGFLCVADWVRRRSVMWLVLPYLCASAFTTFPSSQGLIGWIIEAGIFFFVLAAWRLNRA